MAEYIEREAVCSDCKNQKVCVDKSVCPVGRAPAADVEVVKHGRWVDLYGGKYANPLYVCSECKESALYEHRVNALGGYYTVQALSAHCPNCGVKMMEVSNGLDQH